MLKTISTLFLSYLLLCGMSYVVFGNEGIWGGIISNHPFIFLTLYIITMTHITISCMSLSFHRFHTHKGIVINKYLDSIMQIWLWLITSMSKLDWVSIHIYHHAHSDTEKDPHSPVIKGLFHVFFLGVVDYAKAKDNETVLKIKKTIKMNKLEKFFYEYSLLGPMILTSILVFIFGWQWGSILGIINFLISPIFAVGGVNALAHFFGYKNHQSQDNSRNLGFIFPLNFLICGELDHNNHHSHPRSCSFRHKWYEFDIGYLYIILLSKFKLISVKNIH